jgi:dTDP-4-dehydrorhamnose 3,5-epimerase
MKVTESRLKGVYLIKPRVFEDSRGFFLETYNRDRYRDHGIDADFVQDNYARSPRGILRGMHYQIKHSQAKLVWVPEGEVYDVVVDLRKDSLTFGQWDGYTLSSKNKHQLFVPTGFAHGYCVTSETADFMYKCSDFYYPEDEGGLIWNDPKVGIEWPIEDPVLSEKDQNNPTLEKTVLPDSN